MRRNRLASIYAALAAVAVITPIAAQDDSDASHDGLVLLEDSDADEAWVLPDADFSGYRRFTILEPMVAFRKNWARDYNRNAGRPSERVTDEDMERIKAGMAELFLEVFTQELEDGGYPVVSESAEDVMILRPAIINLDVTAPDIRSANRTRSYSTSAGSATIYVEFFDSVTGQILARAVDSRRARDTGMFQWQTSVSNRAEARNILRRWARMLVDSLDEIAKENN